MYISTSDVQYIDNIVCHDKFLYRDLKDFFLYCDIIVTHNAVVLLQKFTI